MKTLWQDILTAVFMGMILPGILLNLAVMVTGEEAGESIIPETAPQQTAPRQTAPEPAALTMRLRRRDGVVEQLDMDSYLVSVVLAEMPASFEEEALKAQAVVARTYTQRALETGGKHGDGSVCTSSSCCQAYIGEGSYLSQGGTEKGLNRVKAAVLATSGQVLAYEGELIEATYFSCSGGRTEDAAAVWGTDFPYLQAVASPGEEDAAHYTDTVIFSPQDFQNSLGISLDGVPNTWFGTATYTEGGGVATLTIGGETYTGTQLRSLLGLRSTSFTVSAGEDSITITTRGYGHRVGMSQYGADAMAVTGSTYDQILAHYYQGTKLKTLG